MKGGSYILGELNRSLSKLRFAAFRLLPYLPRDVRSVPVTRIAGHDSEEIEDVTHDSGNQWDVELEEEAL